MAKKGGQSSQKLVATQTDHPGKCSPSIKASEKAPFLNSDPFMHWSGPKNIAHIKINDEGSCALLDSGSTINAVTPEFIKAHSLDMGPLSDLVDSTLKINEYQGLFSWPLGYVIIRVHVEGVKGYNEDQVALVIPNLTTFRSRVPVTLGTPTFNQIMNVIKESEKDELSVSLNGSRISHLLWLDIEWDSSLRMTQQPVQPPIWLNWVKAVKTIKWEEIEVFLSKIVHGLTKTVLLGSNMYIMTQAPEKGEEPCLPHSLSVANTYTEMTTGSRAVNIVIKNQTTVPIIIGKSIKVAG